MDGLDLIVDLLWVALLHGLPQVEVVEGRLVLDLPGLELPEVACISLDERRRARLGRLGPGCEAQLAEVLVDQEIRELGVLEQEVAYLGVRVVTLESLLDVLEVGDH